MDQTVIGIDVSKAELVMAVHPSGERWTSETTAIAMDTLVARLRDLGPQLIVMEATAGYELPLAAACTAAHLPIVIRESAPGPGLCPGHRPDREDRRH